MSEGGVLAGFSGRKKEWRTRKQLSGLAYSRRTNSESFITFSIFFVGLALRLGTNIQCNAAGE